MPASVVNIAAYQFARLDGLKALRTRLLKKCRQLELRGTILISKEGINLFLAGSKAAVEEILSEIRSIPGLEGLVPKYSTSVELPFRRMLVRIKKEIIAFGVRGIAPSEYTSPRISPATLKQWLDEGRAVTLLDTRNDYEVRLGTFQNARTLDIDHFRKFPEAVRHLSPELKELPVVTFCTGGIRCEKAAPYLEQQGFREVYQLDGGILKYFEECGSRHYEGECFVFDHRTGLDPNLSESESVQCFVCQAPLSPREQQDPRYLPGESCPYCHAQKASVLQEKLEKRQKVLQQAATPLPGSIPGRHLRPIRVPACFDGVPASQFLATALPHLSRGHWQTRCRAGDIVDEQGVAVEPDRLAKQGERFYRVTNLQVEPPVNPDIQLLYEDADLVVLSKPAPLPVHSGGRFHRNTLLHLLREAYRPLVPRPAHRLDADTTGVMVAALSKRMAAVLQESFTNGSVTKTYLVQVQNHPAEDQFSCSKPIGCLPGKSGKRALDSPDGKAAKTDFWVLERLPDGTALLEAIPITGRTNQIRLHLQCLGFPVIGDAIYGDAQTERDEVFTRGTGDPPLRLHSWKLQFPHPRTGEKMVFEAPPPVWKEQPVSHVTS